MTFFYRWKSSHDHLNLIRTVASIAVEGLQEQEEKLKFLLEQDAAKFAVVVKKVVSTVLRNHDRWSQEMCQSKAKL